MKKTGYEIKFKPDPIIVGDPTKRVNFLLTQVLKCNSTIWKDERRHRDNGKVTK